MLTQSLKSLLLVLVLSSAVSADAVVMKALWEDWQGQLEGAVVLNANDSSEVNNGFLRFYVANYGMQVDGGSWDGEFVDVWGMGCYLGHNDQCTPELPMTYSNGLLMIGDQLVSGSILSASLEEVHPIGDSNMDGVFDSSDLLAVFQWGLYEDQQLWNAQWASGDWNADREFDSGDMLLAFQAGSYNQGAVSVIPEPSALVLFLVGTLLLIRRK